MTAFSVIPNEVRNLRMAAFPVIPNRVRNLRMTGFAWFHRCQGGGG